MKKAFSNLEPEVSVPFFYDKQLEGLRGLAAFGVMVWHGLGMGILDKQNLISDFITYFSIGPLAVYIFFVLSGYVMAFRYQNVSSFNVWKYLKARLFRLYPAYIMLFCLLALISAVPIYQFLTNVFMLQNDNFHLLPFKVISELGPIWSIHYEIVFYLLFPVIIVFRPSVFFIVAALVLAGVFLYYKSYHFLFLSDYCIGFLFWVIGVVIAWKCRVIQKVSFRFLSYTFLLISYTAFMPGSVILKGLNIDSSIGDSIGSHGMGLKTIFYIPICILVIADIAKRKIAYEKMISVITYLIPLIIVGYLMVNNRLFEDTRWVMGGLFYLLALALISEKKYSTLFLNKLSFLGSISYCIYLFHWPLALIIKKYFPLEGSDVAYWIKFFLWIAVTISLSVLTDRILQPKIKTWFANRSPVLSLKS